MLRGVTGSGKWQETQFILLQQHGQLHSLDTFQIHMFSEPGQHKSTCVPSIRYILVFSHITPPPLKYHRLCFCLYSSLSEPCDLT